MKFLRYILATLLATALVFSAVACSPKKKEEEPRFGDPLAQSIKETQDQYKPIVRTKEEITKAQKYVYPKKFNTSQASSDVVYVLTYQKQDLCDIANYFLTHPELRNGFLEYDSSVLELDESYEFSNPDNLNLGSIEPTLKRFLDECPYAIRILVSANILEFQVSEHPGDFPHSCLYFSYFGDLSQEDDENTAMNKVAPHWVYSPNWPGT
jgi:hypothetical protein